MDEKMVLFGEVSFYFTDYRVLQCKLIEFYAWTTVYTIQQFQLFKFAILNHFYLVWLWVKRLPFVLQSPTFRNFFYKISISRRNTNVL